MSKKKALVFLNMGAPRDLGEVEIFLKNMFMDRNIISIKSSIIRWCIANLIVFFRKKEAIKNYKKLGGISPLVGHTKVFIDSVKSSYPEFEVVNIMRYTPPFATNELEKLKEKSIEELYVIPLYPHYSTTTTKSSLEDVKLALKRLSYNPILHIVDRFYKSKGYNMAIINRIKERLAEEDSSTFDLIFSAHSLPQKIVDGGDPYQKEVIENVDLLKGILKEMNIKFNNIHIAYQSKLGPIKWLEPSLEDKLKNIENKRVLIYPISFILDNSESEFELSIEYRDLADKLEYDEYLVCKCINNSKDFVEAIFNEIIASTP
jgi:ferrochelatase